jgi:hypothetical protein
VHRRSDADTGRPAGPAREGQAINVPQGQNLTLYVNSMRPRGILQPARAAGPIVVHWRRGAEPGALRQQCLA